MRSRYGIILLLVALLSSCATPPPRNTHNICSMFYQYPHWKHTTIVTQKKYGIPIAVQMAIIHQESDFIADAKPPRTLLLGIIPWSRPTSAMGYSQAIDHTWRVYKRSTGRYWAERDNFADADDFVGWYASRAKLLSGIAPNDTYSLYLAYHEGLRNYNRQSYYAKPWLLRVSKRVQARAVMYHRQLSRCWMF